MDVKLIDNHAEMEGEPIPTKRGWYYVSKTRKHGRNKLWVGPFGTDQAEICDADVGEWFLTLSANIRAAIVSTMRN